MIQIRYILTIISLLFLTSCIHNNDDSQLTNTYSINYLELNETKSFNENGTIEYRIKVPIFLNKNLENINRFILESVAKFLEKDKLKTNINVIDLQLLKSYVDDNTELMELDNYNTDIEQLELYKTIEMDSIYTINDIIVFESKQESYTGGAHGANSTYFAVFDLKKNKLLLPEDIFELNELTVIAYDYFLTERGLSKKSIDIEKEGYSFNDNKFHLNENYSIDNKKVTFLFNPYEIASYAEGQITIEIPLINLESIIKKEYKFIINKD